MKMDIDLFFQIMFDNKNMHTSHRFSIPFNSSKNSPAKQRRKDKKHKAIIRARRLNHG